MSESDTAASPAGATASPAAVRITIEPARQEAVLDLLRQSDEFTLALYPADSAYLLDVSQLEGEAVRVFVARPATSPGHALGMLALVSRGDGSGELKRMFVTPAARGLGVASRLLAAVEQHARATGITLLQLETGPLSPNAIALYAKHGYAHIANFGPYIGDELSYCMEKPLPPAHP